MGMPWLRYFPLFSSTFKEFDSQVSSTYSFFEFNIFERIKKRFNEENKEETSKDLLDYFLDQMEEEKKNGGKNTGEFK